MLPYPLPDPPNTLESNSLPALSSLPSRAAPSATHQEHTPVPEPPHPSFDLNLRTRSVSETQSLNIAPDPSVVLLSSSPLPVTPGSIRDVDRELPSGASTPRTSYTFAAQAFNDYWKGLSEFLHPIFYEWLREWQLVQPDIEQLTPNRTRVNPKANARRHAAKDVAV